jgi:hypothetical protein
MGDEKIGKHYDLHGRVRLEVGHQLSQFDDRCGNKRAAEDRERRVRAASEEYFRAGYIIPARII